MKRWLAALVIATAFLTVFVVTAQGEDVWVSVDSDSVTVHHHDALYNCCWIIAAEIETAAPIIDLREVRGPGSEDCLCYCSFDLLFRFAVEMPGDYLLRVWYLDTLGQWEYVLMGEVPIHIEGGQPPGAPLTMQSPCGGWATDAPESPASALRAWSAIKALY